MRESDIIAPLGLMSIMGMLAGDKKSNLLQEQIETYQKEQEEAKNKKEEEVPVVEEQNQELTSSDLLSETGSDVFNSILGSAFMPGGLIGKGLAFTTGMNLATGFGNETIQDMVEVIDPEGVTKTVPPEGDGPGFLEGIMDFYRDMAGDDGQLELTPNFLAPGGQSPYIGYKDGGLVPPLRGPMANGVGNLFKLK